MLVPLNWRLTVAEQLFILSDAGPKVLVLEQAFDALLPALAGQLSDTFAAGLDFSPLGGSKWDCLVDQGRGGTRTCLAASDCLYFRYHRAAERRCAASRSVAVE